MPDGKLERILQKPQLSDADYAEVVLIVRGSQGIDASLEHASRFSERARAELQVFAPSPAREALEELTRFVVRRKN